MNSPKYVTVPRWALEYVLKHDLAPTTDWAFACAALQRALDAKTEFERLKNAIGRALDAKTEMPGEMPDEYGHPGPGCICPDCRGG